eukprot:c21956_g1_i1 orf=3-329(-)
MWVCMDAHACNNHIYIYATIYAQTDTNACTQMCTKSYMSRQVPMYTRSDSVTSLIPCGIQCKDGEYHGQSHLASFKTFSLSVPSIKDKSAFLLISIHQLNPGFFHALFF